METQASQQIASHLHRSHFGSRYKLGCCGHAGLLCAWVRFPAARQQHAQSRGPLCNCSPGEFPRGQAFQPDEPMASPQGADCTCRSKHLKLAWKVPPCAWNSALLTSSALITHARHAVLHRMPSQRSLHNAPIFRLLLKVAVNGTHQCDFLNFCGGLGPQHVHKALCSQ